MQMPGRSMGDSYRYGFNGAEKIDEIAGVGNHYDLGLREYVARLGRMFSIDPRSPEYSWQSPYVYHRNSPIFWLDYLGGGDDELTSESQSRYTGGAGEDGNGPSSANEGDIWNNLDDELTYTYNGGAWTTQNPGFKIVPNDTEGTVGGGDPSLQDNYVKFGSDAGIRNQEAVEAAQLAKLAIVALSFHVNLSQFGQSGAGSKSKASSFSPEFNRSSSEVWLSISAKAADVAGTNIRATAFKINPVKFGPEYCVLYIRAALMPPTALKKNARQHGPRSK